MHRVFFDIRIQYRIPEIILGAPFLGILLRSCCRISLGLQSNALDISMHALVFDHDLVLCHSVITFSLLPVKANGSVEPPVYHYSGVVELKLGAD